MAVLGANGAGIGASHQTGWTGLVAPLVKMLGHLDGKTYLEAGRAAVFEFDDPTSPAHAQLVEIVRRLAAKPQQHGSTLSVAPLSN